MFRVNLSQIEFKNWNTISEGKTRQFGPPIRKISSFFGKTYFYYDPQKSQLHAKNFNIIERLLHIFFGYQSKFNRQNLWQFLKERKWVKPDESCPTQARFRKVVGEQFSNFSKTKGDLFWDVRRVSEKGYQQ